MDRFLIKGPAKLSGEVTCSLSKNATLPIMAATLLNSGISTLSGIPKIKDIKTFKTLLFSLGCKVDGDSIDATKILHVNATYDIVKTMRASVLVLGPLLSRFGQAKVSLPGGCAIGARPIDIHLKGLEKLGAVIDIEDGYVNARTKLGHLVGSLIDLPFPSVGATENLMMAACYAKGLTIIENAAKEPEIRDLALFLKELGFKIEGEGTDRIKIMGQDEIVKVDVDYSPIADRIEALTLIMSALATKSVVTIKNVPTNDIKFPLQLLTNIGAKFLIKNDEVKVLDSILRPVQVATDIYPKFPTDAQAQLMALMLSVDGKSIIEEKIFENRFMHVPELNRMGAHISLNGHRACIVGGFPLAGAPVMCTDLRASAALVISAMMAEGESSVERVYHLDRGYEELDKKLSLLGADIKRINDC